MIIQISFSHCPDISPPRLCLCLQVLPLLSFVYGRWLRNYLITLQLILHEFLGIQNTSRTYSSCTYGFVFKFNFFLVISLFFLSVKCGENEMTYVWCLAPGKTSVFTDPHIFLHGKCRGTNTGRRIWKTKVQVGHQLNQGAQ